MAGRVVLHLGAMKTGTSYLQSVLGANQGALEDAGFAFLGSRFGVQARAVRDVLNLPKAPRRNRRRWQDIAREARQLDGRTGIVSMEFLSFARPRHVEAFLAPLRGLEVEVVMTVRDQFRAIPAQWQTYTRNFGTDDWAQYLRNIETGRMRRTNDTRAHLTFHRAQDVLPALELWSSSDKVVRTHVVTVPAPGAPREELWHRFRGAVGIPEVPVDVEGVHDNASLGYGSCEYLARLNAQLQDVRPRKYRSGLAELARGALVARRGQESKPALDLRAAKLARARNEELRAGLERSGYQLHGSLDDLPVPRDLAAYPRRVAAVDPAEVTAAAHAAWTFLAGELGEGGTPPADLDALVRGTASMLRTVKGWDEA